MNLANRLRVLDWHRTHPELAATKVEAPLILVGMPRSGTTALSHLLAADPDNRSLLAWEATESIPPPTTGDVPDRSPLRARPRTRRAPPSCSTPSSRRSTTTSPTTRWSARCCTRSTSRASSTPPCSTSRRTTSGCSRRRGRARSGTTEQVLQVLQSECPGRWQLKSPQYGLLLDELFDDLSGRAARRHAPRPGEDRGVDVQPAALPHRHLHQRRPHRVHRRALAGRRSRRCSTARWKPATGSVRTSFFDVAYADIVRDPVSGGGLDLPSASGSSGTTTRRSTSVASTPPTRSTSTARTPIHSPRWAVERGTLDERFARYMARYDVPKEDA